MAGGTVYTKEDDSEKEVCRDQLENVFLDSSYDQCDDMLDTNDFKQYM